MHNVALKVSGPELSLRQQILVAEFGRFAMQTDSFQKIVNEASVVAAKGLDARFAKVLEYLADDKEFLVRSGVGWSEGVVGHARPGSDVQSPAGYAFQTGQSVISNHLANEERFRTPKLLADHGIRSAINVLIQAGDGQPFGVLEGDSTNRSDFNDYDVAFLQSLANTLAIAVDAQKRQEAREELLREKETLILEKDKLLSENQVLLCEKDLLMKEGHHRVKNSLQLVQMILSTQARRLTSPEAKAQVEEAAARILTIAAVHHRLYDGGSITSADAAPYLRGLLTEMKGLLTDAADARELDLDIEPFMLGADDITPLGLITGELVTNAFKHGRGNIRVAVRRDAGGLEISVSDEGSGFPAGFDPAGCRGLGMRLIVALTKMTDGEAIQVDRSVSFGRIVVRTVFGGSEPSIA